MRVIGSLILGTLVVLAFIVNRVRLKALVYIGMDMDTDDALTAILDEEVAR